MGLTGPPGPSRLYSDWEKLVLPSSDDGEVEVGMEDPNGMSGDMTPFTRSKARFTLPTFGVTRW